MCKSMIEEHLKTKIIMVVPRQDILEDSHCFAENMLVIQETFQIFIQIIAIPITRDEQKGKHGNPPLAVLWHLSKAISD